MRVLIAGAAGFIEADLCRRHVAGDHGDAVLDDLSGGRFRSNLDSIEADMSEARIPGLGALRSAAYGTETVSHLPARLSVSCPIVCLILRHDVNVNGIVNVPAWRRATRVRTSSSYRRHRSTARAANCPGTTTCDHNS